MTEPTASPATASSTTGPRAAGRLAILAWAALYAAVAASIHFGAVSVPWDTDTAYHVAVGRLIREHGILHAFPWTPFSWLADHYADKELLFHLLLVPLAGAGWITAAKVVGTVAGTALLLALYLVLRAERVPLSGPWAMVPLLASDVFVFRFALVRPHLLSVALAAVVLWAASRERLAVLAVACALYPWAYVALPLPLVLVAIAEGARLACGRRPGWRAPASALAGLLVGVALHPNALNLVRLSWVQIVDVMLLGAWAGRPDLELGREFDPFTIRQWLSWMMGATAMVAAALALGWRVRRERATPFAFALAALAFGLLTVRTARFAEYFVPLSAVALALGLAARQTGRTAPAGGRHVALGGVVPLRRWVVPLGVAAALAVYSGPALVETLRGLRSRPDRLPPALAATLQREIPPGAQVFTCDWGRTGDLLLALPNRRFMVALDPTFFWLQDPVRYRLWREIPRRPPPHAAERIRETFGARWVVCFWDDRFRSFFDQLAFEPGVRTVLLTEDWNVYELREP